MVLHNTLFWGIVLIFLFNDHLIYSLKKDLGGGHMCTYFNFIAIFFLNSHSSNLFQYENWLKEECCGLGYLLTRVQVGSRENLRNYTCVIGQWTCLIIACAILPSPIVLSTYYSRSFLVRSQDKHVWLTQPCIVYKKRGVISEGECPSVM